MILKARPLKITVPTQAEPLDFFLRQIDSLEHSSRAVCFTRYIGMEKTETEYITLINSIDTYFMEKESRVSYLRLSRFALPSPDELTALSAQYDGWLQLQNDDTSILHTFDFPVKLPTDTLDWTQKRAFQSVLRLYNTHTPFVTPSMTRNFGIKVFGWIKRYLPCLFFTPDGMPARHFPKLVFCGAIKRQELLFLYFLSLLGCDIFYMNCTGDICADYPEAATFSMLYKCRHLAKTDLPIPNPPAAVSVNLTRPSQPPTKKPPATAAAVPITIPELSYEALAKQSASVVMIKVRDETQKCFKTGSGVVINSSGYILTNFHVVCGGDSFAIQYENESQEHLAQSLVKYHSDYDLAIIKVDKSCTPLTLSETETLVRGQQIVAIGSPLGLFNTISNGIISGFRHLEKKSMIQFTAPISSGSSGGALLDMRGHLIGLITAGFDDGQNLNLAVDHQTIRDFVRNFI